jgi:hypothetical protein
VVDFDPAWPDKAMFAALLLITGGLLGLGVEGLRSVATVKDHLPTGILTDYPQWLSAAMAALTVVFGVLCHRTQGALFGYLGAASGLLSFAYDGLVPFLSLLAIIMLIRSKIEGEETKVDGIILKAALWPDKAMAASLFMVVGGAVTLFQGIAIATHHYDPVILSSRLLAVVIDLVAGIACMAFAVPVYHLRQSYLGEVGGVLTFCTFGLILLGPAIGLVIFTYMFLARHEDEFNTPPATLRRHVGRRAPRRSKTAAKA